MNMICLCAPYCGSHEPKSPSFSKCYSQLNLFGSKQLIINTLWGNGVLGAAGCCRLSAVATGTLQGVSTGALSVQLKATGQSQGQLLVYLHIIPLHKHQTKENCKHQRWDGSRSGLEGPVTCLNVFKHLCEWLTFGTAVMLLAPWVSSGGELLMIGWEEGAFPFELPFVSTTSFDSFFLLNVFTIGWS